MAFQNPLGKTALFIGNNRLLDTKLLQVRKGLQHIGIRLTIRACTFKIVVDKNLHHLRPLSVARRLGNRIPSLTHHPPRAMANPVTDISHGDPRQLIMVERTVCGLRYFASRIQERAIQIKHHQGHPFKPSARLDAFDP